MVVTKTKNAPHPRRKSMQNKKQTRSIIAFLNKETAYGDKYWHIALFMFCFLTIIMQGMNIVIPLYWLGLITI